MLLIQMREVSKMFPLLQHLLQECKLHQKAIPK